MRSRAHPGMVPFDEADSARFFGREQEIQELIERLPHPTFTSHLLDDAAALAKQGKIAAALAGYAKAKRSSPGYVIAAAYWNKLCRAGVLWGQVQAVQESCGRAVALDPKNGDYRDSRGISR